MTLISKSSLMRSGSGRAMLCWGINRFLIDVRSRFKISLRPPRDMFIAELVVLIATVLC